jgi:DNA-binding LacI/PurR family transcriptional regulator
VEVRTRRPRIADVAREAGVSKTAVSFAFNSPDRLAPETATRIREVAEALGYRPHPVARMLSQRRTRALGILVPQALSVVFSNPFFGAFAEGVALATEDSGYALHFISPVHGSLARAIGRATVDGIVGIGLSARHPEVEAIERSGIAMVLVDSSPFGEHPSVDTDDEAGARAAAAHLIGLGHRDILVLAVEPSVTGTDEDPEDVPGRRLRGYRTVLADAGLDLPHRALVVGPASIDGGRAAVHRAWEDDLRPTAILAMSDAMAIGAMEAVRDLHLVVPGDVSVVGFDDVEMARHTDPPLTTVHQPIRRKGEEAARLLLSLVDGHGGEAPEHRLHATRLIVRASTAPPTGRAAAGRLPD